MAVYKLVYDPAPVLRKKAVPVEDFGANFQQLIDDMFETMYTSEGCGLAAPQIGLPLAVSVIDVSRDRSGQMVIANPDIISSEGEQELPAGCLSVPGAYAKVTRPAKVTVRAQSRHGEFFEVQGEGLLGECLQHEIDHLNGLLFIDHLSALKRTMLRNKSRKFRTRQS